MNAICTKTPVVNPTRSKSPSVRQNSDIWMSFLSSNSFADLYGPIEICVAISGVLNGCLVMQMISYFCRFRNDPLGFKVVVRKQVLLLSCIEANAFHEDCVDMHARRVELLEIPVGFSAAIALEVIVHAMVQGIYIYRIYSLGHKIFLLVACCALVLAQIGLAFAWVGAVAHKMTITSIIVINIDRRPVISAVLASSALLDVILTVSMCLQLRQNRLDGLKRTAHIVDTLTRWTIESGMVTSIIAIIALIVWQVDQESNLWIGLGICLTSCYALTLMGLINGRTLLNTPHEFTLNSIPITTMQLNHHSRVSRPPPAEC
ncbi:hypothetical protein BD779DRAFT_1787912 [Infundibulicybe gibba]|nr:hypothetical protein BD779DRAFT_1787912 [Infundibulicybe gibba]